MALVDRHINDFLQEVKRLDPELRQQINGSQGLFHVQMGDFRSFISRSIDDGRFEAYDKAMAILERYFSPEIDRDARFEYFTNAVYVSLFEHLFFDSENGIQALGRTPQYIRDTYAHFLKQLEASAPVKPHHLTRKERLQAHQKKQAR